AWRTARRPRRSRSRNAARGGARAGGAGRPCRYTSLFARLDHHRRPGVTGSFRESERKGSDYQTQIDQIFHEPNHSALRPPAYAPSHRVESGRQTGGHARGIIAQGKVLVAHHRKSARGKKLLHIEIAEIEEMARHVDAVPRLAK